MSSLHITIIQSALHWENKSANLNSFEEKINSINGKNEIVVLPEMFSTGFTMQPELFAETMDGETTQWMRRIAKEKKIILTGGVIIKEDENYYNRLLWVLPNGIIYHYDKRHLFAYAGEDKKYNAGNKKIIISVNDWKISPLICYDLRFPVWSRRTKENDYDLIIYVANWPERRNQAWKTLLQARAIENQSYVVGVNRVGDDGHGVYHSGDSAVINPMGEVLYSKTKEEDIFTIQLEKETVNQIREKLPFQKDGDDFHIEI
ncbi:MAG: amidohydrolase [Chitinophagaceae bacterium]|nr:MAG: amidohydrolase [Chitinophagaceae bacterium]